MLALGGGFQAYFTQMRDAAVRTWQVPLMRDVASVRARAPAVLPPGDGRAAGRAGVRGVRVLPHEPAAVRAVRRRADPRCAGILQNLLDAQQSVEITMEHHLRGRMADYPLIVYPEWPTATPSFRAELLDYVRGGGTLLVVGPRAGRLFDDVSGSPAEGAPVDGVALARARRAARGAEDVARCLHRAWGRASALPVRGAAASAARRTIARPRLHDHDVRRPRRRSRRSARGRLAIAWLNLGERYLNGRTLEAAASSRRSSRGSSRSRSPASPALASWTSP